MTRLLLFSMFFFLSCGMVFAADTISQLEGSLASAADDSERAQIDKKIGDMYASRDDLRRAAKYYVKALSLGKFPEEERLQLAVGISWGGMFSEAAEEFRAIAAQDPANLKAGIGLARTLFWMNDNAGALEETEKVLKQAPGDRDALLIRANALRRSDKINEALAIYSELMETGPDFDTRSGYAYALLAKGDRPAAISAARSLKPQYPYQKRELAELRAELAAVAKPAAAPVPPEPPRETPAADGIAELKKKLAAAADKNEQALLDKRIGDAYAAGDDLAGAAGFYIKALSLGQFPVEDRLKLATSISWGGRLSEAANEFRALAAQDPSDLKAGVALARTLLWMDDTDGALKEINRVLAQAPADRDALLVKANVLRQRKGIKEAIAIYDNLLEKGADFDTQTGLAYALLEKGDRDAARSAAAALTAQYPYQKDELKELAAELEAGAEQSPAPEPGKAEASVAQQAPAAPGDGIQDLKRALSAAREKDERARLNKEIGDAYAEKEDFEHAAGFYSKALTLGKFTPEDRMAMATRISWGGCLPDAAKEYRALYSEDPSNLKAGTALAKTLSWMGDNSGALTVINKVLWQAPDDREALLVEANALRWRNGPAKAIAIYNKLLETGDDFDARSGLVSALLARGDRKEARSAAASLKAQYSYQEREINELAAELAGGARPVLDASAGYYKDTDSNRVRTYTLLYGQWLGNTKADLGFKYLDATAPGLRDSAEIASAGAYQKLTDSLGAGAGLSLDLAKKSDTADFLTWNVKADKSITDGSVGISALSYLLTDTAQLIANRIRAVSYGLSASRKLNARFSLNGAYSYKDYSDNNGSNDLQAALSYLLIRQNPGLTVGYKCRYFGFRRQSGGGYFDPTYYLAHQLFASLSFESGRFYTTLEPYGGYQYITRNGKRTGDYYGGGSGTLGFKASKKLSIELNGEGGNYALQSATGFSYYQAGARIVYAF